MKRLGRWLFNLAAAAALVLCAATVVLWVWSYRISNGIDYSRLESTEDRNKDVWWNVRHHFSWSIYQLDGTFRGVFVDSESKINDGQFPRPIINNPPQWKYTRSNREGEGRDKLIVRFQDIFVHRLGFEYSPSEEKVDRSDYSEDVNRIDIAFPHWAILLICAILPATRIVHLIRIRHRFRTGLCQACGYDLRATPERCPECGTIPLKKETISN